MISAYADDIEIIAKYRGNLNRVIKMVETVFSKLNLKLNKKKCGIMRIMKKALRRPKLKKLKDLNS
jgi:ribosomal protein L17